MKNLIFIFLAFATVNVWSQKNKLNPELRNRKWGYVNEDNEVVIDFQYEGVSDFSEGLAAVKKDDKYGYIDKKGKTIIGFKFDFADDFKSSYARVAKDTLKNKKWGYIRKDGSLALDYQFSYADNFDDFYAKVVKDTLSALIKTDGKLFLEKWFYSVRSFKDGFVQVTEKNKGTNSELTDDYIVSYYDKNEKLLGNRWFSGGGDFSNGIAKVSIAGECFRLDKKGRLKTRVCDPYDEAFPIVEFKPADNSDEAPKFPGGELAMRKFLASNVRYPNVARERGIEGRVHVRFTINPNGWVENAHIVRSVDNDIDNEALRVVKMLPQWTPGRKNGKPVYSFYVVPINFALQ